MRNRITICVLGVLLGSARPNQAQQNTATVHIEVAETDPRHPTKTKPLSNVLVIAVGPFGPYPRTVNEQDEIDLETGQWTLTATKAGYSEAKATVDIQGTGAPYTVKVQLKAHGGGHISSSDSSAIRFVLAFQDPASAPPPQNSAGCRMPHGRVQLDPEAQGEVRVAAYAMSGNSLGEQLKQAYTAPDGSFELKLPMERTFDQYLLTITRPGYVSFSRIFGRCDFPDGNPVYTLQRFEAPQEAVQTLEGARRKLFTPPLMDELPLPGFRNFDYLALLVPGVAPTPQASGTAGPGISPAVGSPGLVVVNGLTGRNNNYTVDGSDNNDELLGMRRQGFVSISPQPVQSIQEFQVLAAAGGVQYGRAIAAQVNVQTRSGELELHGQVFGYLTDNAWNARDYFFQNIAGGQPGPPLTRQADGATVLSDNQLIPTRLPAAGKAPFSRTDDGVAAGGTLRRIGVAYYGAYERRNRNGYEEHSFAVPTLAQRAIDPIGGPGDRGFQSLESFTPGTRSIASFFPATLPGNALFSLYPLPNNPAGSYGANTYTSRYSEFGRGRLYNFKLEHNLGSHGSISGRYNRGSEHSRLPVTGGALDSSMAPRIMEQNLAFFINSPQLALAPARRAAFSSVTRVSFGRTGMDFSDVGGRSPSPSGFFPNVPFLLNAPLVLNVTKPDSNDNPTQPVLVSADGAGASYMKAVGLPGVTHSEAITGPLGEVIVGGYSSVGVDVFRFPQRRADHTVQIANHIAGNLGRHAISYGVDARRVDLNSDLNRNAAPLAEFHGTYGNVQGLNSQQLSALSLVAAGTPTRLQQTLTTSSSNNLSLHTLQVDLYANYGVTLASRVHIDAGFRLGINGAPGGLDQRIASEFNSKTLDDQITSAEQTCAPQCTGRLAYLRTAFPGDFASVFRADKIGNDGRLGFAWNVLDSGKLAIRGGIGSYTGEFPAIVMSESRSAFPSSLPLNFANGPGYHSSGSERLGAFLYLSNLANPLLRAQDPTLGILQGNSLNQLNPAFAADPVHLLGLQINTLYPTLMPTSPATRLKHPYAMQYALTVECELSPGMVASVGYVGTQGRKLLRVTTPDLAVRTPQIARAHA